MLPRKPSIYENTLLSRADSLNNLKLKKEYLDPYGRYSVNMNSSFQAWSPNWLMVKAYKTAHVSCCFHDSRQNNYDTEVYVARLGLFRLLVLMDDKMHYSNDNM